MTRTGPEPQVEGRATVWPVLFLLWSVSLVRVAGALWSHETFGPGATLATLAVLVGPVALAVWTIRHRQARSLREPPER